MKEVPIACTLTPDQMAARASTLLPELVARVQEQQDVPGGIRLRFAAESETLRLIATVIDAERQCCRFLRLQQRIDGQTRLTSADPGGLPASLAAEGLRQSASECSERK